MTLKTKAAVLLTSSAVTAGSLFGLGATSASAAPAAGGDLCNRISVVKNNSDGYGKLKKNLEVRESPYAACRGAEFKKGSRVYYWCYVHNDYGNKWVYVRVAGTTYTGWVHRPNIDHTKGSLKHC